MFLCRLRILIALLLTLSAMQASEPHFISLRKARHDVRTLDGLRTLHQAAGTALATNPPAKIRRGLASLQSLAALAQTAGAEDRAALLHDLLEVAAALQNNNRTPVPRTID